MARYLLVAEADKIQSTLFRATRLAEIIGGSRMLTQWCHDMAGEMRAAGVPEEDIIVADGGTFRVILASKDECWNWRERLAESYATKLSGTLTVAKPLKFESGEFGAKSEQGQREVRLAKNNPPVSAAALHNPYVAYCDVCGTGLANQHNPSENPLASRQFVCKSCSRKQILARGEFYYKNDGFLGDFIERVGDHVPEGRNIHLARTSEEIARYDERNNIACLVADGNDMGILFGACDQVQMKQLSRRLPEIMLESAAETTAKVINSMVCTDGVSRGATDKATLCPVLPLIMGGDDLYIQLATPYALDFARHFAQAFVRKLSSEIRALGLEGGISPSICMGLVFCKAKFPYSFAYKRAHDLLKQAKSLAREKGAALSLIALGRAPSSEHKGDVRPTLQPYNLLDNHVDTIIPLDSLMKSKMALSEIPPSRLAELHNLYARAASEDKRPKQNEWLKQQFSYFLKRLQRAGMDYAKLLEVMSTLGSEYADQLYMREAAHMGPGVYGTAIPDLLEFWDYATKLNEG